MSGDGQRLVLVQGVTEQEPEPKDGASSCVCPVLPPLLRLSVPTATLSLFARGAARSHSEDLASFPCATTDNNGVMDVCHCSVTNVQAVRN